MTANATAHTEAGLIRIQFRIGPTIVAATLDGSRTSRDFAALLPLDLDFFDLFRREKSAPLPRALVEEKARRFTYEIGEVVYWPPSRHVAVFYRQDRRSFPVPGMIRLGRIDSGGVETFANGVSLRVSIDRLG